MTFADSLRQVRNILTTITITTDLAVHELAKQALAVLPNPEDVEGLEKASPTYWLELGRKMGTLVRQKGELEKDVAKLVGLLQEGSGLVMESSLSDLTLKVQNATLTAALINYGGHKNCMGRSAESCNCGWIDAVLVAKRMEKAE